MFSNPDKSRMPVAMVALLAISALLSGCLDGSDFATLETPSWETGYSWDWDMDAASSYASPEASGSSSHSESMRMVVEGTAGLKDGDSAYVVSHEQGMSQLYDNSRLQLVSQDGLEPLATSWDDIDCDEEIRWRDESRYGPSMFPPIRFPLVAGTSWTTEWDGMEWDVEVLSKDDVEVAAGTFDAVELRFRSQDDEDMGMGMGMGMGMYGHDELEDFHLEMSVWYAEEARQIVKLAGENRLTGLVEDETVEQTNTIDVELTSYSLEAKEGVQLDSVVVEPRHPVPMPPLQIVADEDLPLNSAEGNTTVTFSLEEHSYGPMLRAVPEGPPGSSPDGPDSVEPYPMREYEYPDDWDEDKLHWALTESTGHWSEDRLAEGEGAEFTVDLPEYGNFRVTVSDEPIPDRNDSGVAMEMEMPAPHSAHRSCSGASYTSSFSKSTSVRVFIEDDYSVEHPAGMPEEITLGSFVAPDSTGILQADYEVQPDLADTDEAQLVLVAPDGDRTSLDPGEELSISQPGEWELVWDTRGFQELVATGHSAEVVVTVHPTWAF